MLVLQVTGVVILCVVVVLTVAVGLVRRSRTGRLREVRLTRSASTRSAPAPTPAPAPAPTHAPAPDRSAHPVDPDRPDLRALLGQLGATPGERATLLQFSSAFCAPCRATRRVLTDVSGLVEGVAHVEVDAEQHLDVVRRLRIHKTPTTLVLDGDVREIRRATGQPRRADVLAALGHALP